MIVGTQNTYSIINVLEEWQVTNYSHYSNQDLADMIIRWLQALSELYPSIQEGLIIWCDRSQNAFIEMLDHTATRLGIEWFTFTESIQFEVEWLTGFKQWLISSNKLNISPMCNILYKELLMATWDLKASKLKLLNSCADHMMDAFDYSLIPWYNKFIEYANPYFFPGGNKYLKALERFNFPTSPSLTN